MTDGIIKGTGNSRYLKSVANVMALYPEYTDFLKALAEGTFPVDLYGINAGGWQVRGNDINKASLLTDAVETSIWGSAANRTVSQALQQLRSLIATAQSKADAAPKIAKGTYIGTGGTSKILYTGFTPKFMFLGVGGDSYGILSVVSAGTTVSIENNNSYKGVTVSASSYNVTISGNNNNLPSFNYSSFEYMYFAIG